MKRRLHLRCGLASRFRLLRVSFAQLVIAALVGAASGCFGGPSVGAPGDAGAKAEASATTDAGPPVAEGTPTDGSLGADAPLGVGADAGSPDASPYAGSLPAEVGFFDIPGQPTAATYPARMFYVFKPAGIDAAHKPLLVLSNGGPGAATTALIFAYGTGPLTLDPLSDSGVPVPNPASWTAFANLLYIDARQAGFSYGFSTGSSGDSGLPTTPPCNFSEVEDAADFVRALLGFFDTHETLRTNPVVMVGESYAGTRITWMLDLLLRYGTEAALGGADLQARIQAHYDKVFPSLAGTIIDQDTASKQFSAQVLIQTLVLGNLQYSHASKLLATDPYLGASIDGGASGTDPYDALKPAGWTTQIVGQSEEMLSHDTTAALMLGAPLASIVDLQPDSRIGAFHQDAPASFAPNDPEELAANQALTTLLGSLGPGDQYFSPQGEECTGSWSPSDASDNLFVANLRTVKTFLTDARYDPDILAEAIPATFAAVDAGGVIDTAPRPGVARPGWFPVSFPAADGGPGWTTEVRFPTYDQSGHFVEITQPAELEADVQAWLADVQNK